MKLNSGKKAISGKFVTLVFRKHQKTVNKRNFETLVEEEDDSIICMIGTNNRHQAIWDKAVYNPSEFMEKFYQNIKLLYQKLQETGKTVIFMANIPASEANENATREVFQP